MKSYIANVRIREQDRNGNTYHDVQLLDMNGNIICQINKEYGYGQQYKQTTVDMIKALRPDLNDLKYYNVDEGVVFIVNHF